MNENNLFLSKYMNVPRICEKCGKANPEYRGVGEYKCSECGFIMYDDFGVVRNYLEVHKGATQSEVHHATGVPMDTIRQFLREERLEITEGSGVMMACEICRAPIRSGRYCAECAKAVERRIKEEKINSHSKPSVQGYGMGGKGESGARRFVR